MAEVPKAQVHVLTSEKSGEFKSQSPRESWVIKLLFWHIKMVAIIMCSFDFETQTIVKNIKGPEQIRSYRQWSSGND